MIYNDFKGEKLSALGLGMMRLPVKAKIYTNIDTKQVEQMVKYALDNGINYFDTAWGYHLGKSETTVGKVLSKYPRDSYNLATKFPGYDTRHFGRHEKIFEKQLEKCKTDYFDFYLMHCVDEKNIEYYLNDEKYGTVSYFVQKKKEGKIRHLGFSVHASYETFKRFLDKYGEHMEFCQIQLNWIDFNFQEANKKIELLNKLGIAIWVMEPVRGGKLAQLAPEQMAKLEKLRPGVSSVEWCFRYLQSMGTTMILSGMSNLEQIKDNVRIFSESKPTTDEENQVLYNIGYEMSGSVPCTACRYCISKCPKNIEIPDLIKIYNDNRGFDNKSIKSSVLSSIEIGKRPDDCIGCRSCEAVCPQEIRISEVFSDFKSRLK